MAHVTAVSGTECKIATVIIPFFSRSLTPHLLIVSQDVAETCILTVATPFMPDLKYKFLDSV